jgi:hypothetical protein
LFKQFLAGKSLNTLEAAHDLATSLWQASMQTTNVPEEAWGPDLDKFVRISTKLKSVVPPFLPSTTLPLPLVLRAKLSGALTIYGNDAKWPRCAREWRCK